MVEDAFLDGLRELLAELQQQALAGDTPGADQCTLTLDVSPGAGDAGTRVRLWMTVEPFSEEQPVEEDEVTFLLRSGSVEELAFRRFFLEQRVEAWLVRNKQADERLLADIRTFFCRRQGSEPAV